MSWTDEELLKGINYLYPYNSWRLRNGERNPKADEITNHVLNLKHPRVTPGRDPIRYDAAVAVFTKRLIAALGRLSDEQLPQLAVIIPKSTAGMYSEGMAEVAINASLSRNIRCDCECLTRETTIEKRAGGNNRSAIDHLMSISVDSNKFNPGDRILLIDDVTTTGNSMFACKQLLQQAGAGSVIMLALTSTVLEEQ